MERRRQEEEVRLSLTLPGRLNMARISGDENGARSIEREIELGRIRARETEKARDLGYSEPEAKRFGYESAMARGAEFSREDANAAREEREKAKLARESVEERQRELSLSSLVAQNRRE